MKICKENFFYSPNIFVVKEEYLDINTFPSHTHPEYELILILKGSGKRFVGDNISEFHAGDLCFFGPHLPHSYKNKHLSDDTEMHQIVVQFTEDFLGKGFFDTVPFKSIKSLFSQSARGYNFAGDTVHIVRKKMIELVKQDETESVIQLLSILHILSKSSEYKFLVSHGFNKQPHAESDRMDRVFNYIFENFSKDLSLNEIASIACMSPEAFCRYFKKHTRKTLSQFVIEIRIGHACKLLQQRNMSVAQISNQSGFNNISYFNRKFKLLYQRTPLEYQRVFSSDFNGHFQLTT